MILPILAFGVAPSLSIAVDSLLNNRRPFN